MKIVKFKDGTYGVRKWNWVHRWYSFYDLRANDYWWTRDRKERYCKGTYEQALKAYNKLTDNGTSVKIIS